MYNNIILFPFYSDIALVTGYISLEGVLGDWCLHQCATDQIPRRDVTQAISGECYGMLYIQEDGLLLQCFQSLLVYALSSMLPSR